MQWISGLGLYLDQIVKAALSLVLLFHPKSEKHIIERELVLLFHAKSEEHIIEREENKMLTAEREGEREQATRT